MSSKPSMSVIVIFGPPAVGKMTVGRELARLTGMPLFHNHMTLEPLLQLFPYGSPSFRRLNRLFREEIFAEIAKVGGPGVIFTYVWDLSDPSDQAELERYLSPFAPSAELTFVELVASQATRLVRNRGAERLDAKPSKRDLAWSEKDLLESDERYVMNTGPSRPFLFPDRHLRIDNGDLEPTDVARRISERLGL